MLILLRHAEGTGEALRDARLSEIILDTSDGPIRIVAKSVDRGRGRVQLGIDAPATVRVRRSELETRGEVEGVPA